METAISFVAKNGLENITTKKVAAALGISEGSVFYYFKNKKELLVQCLYYVDRQIDPVLKKVPLAGLNLMKNVRLIWNAYINFFISHPPYARFYRDFRNSSYYTQDVMKGQGESFPFFGRFVMKYAALLGIDMYVFWIYVIETTLNYAVIMSEGRLDKSEQTLERVFQLISYGMYGVFKRKREEDIQLELNQENL